MIELLLLPIVAGLAIVTVAGPLGSFIIWRRMAYFGDALAHSALLGVALGLWLTINLAVAATVGCVLIGAMLTLLQRQHRLETDSLLGILSHTCLSLGLIAVSLVDNIHVDLMAFLFGDILSVTDEEVIGILACSLVIVVVLMLLWRPLLSITVDEELAKVEGLPVEYLRLTLMLLIALIIALSMKVVGVLLITSLLIIPAAAARNLAKSPETMAIFASVIGFIGLLLGLTASYYVDIPAGPAVVACCAVMFALSLLSHRSS